MTPRRDARTAAAAKKVKSATHFPQVIRKTFRYDLVKGSILNTRMNERALMDNRNDNVSGRRVPGQAPSQDGQRAASLQQLPSISPQNNQRVAAPQSSQRTASPQAGQRAASSQQPRPASPQQPRPERSAAENRSATRQAPRKRAAGARPSTAGQGARLSDRIASAAQNASRAVTEKQAASRNAAANQGASRTFANQSAPRNASADQSTPRTSTTSASRTEAGTETRGTSRPTARTSNGAQPRQRTAGSARPSMRNASNARTNSQTGTRPIAAGNNRANTPPGISGFVSQLTPARIGIFAGGILLLLLLAFGLSKCAGGKSDAGAEAEKADPNRVSFVAVGDNLPDNYLAEYADAWGGEVGDGEYDWTPLYDPIKDYVSKADLSYVKQETHCGGDDIGPKGYPSFNTTDSMADAIVSTGFDLVASASNHSYDWGAFGANEHSRSVWNEQPVVYTGTATSQEEADELALIEVKGMTFALLDYTYGVNGYTEDDLKPYEVNFMDKDRIAEDVERAKEEADVVLVAMHWGTENQTTPDDQQLEYAQYLADLGVDVILGSHPHVIGQLTELTGEGGNKTLCAYSLGNFVSRHETPGPINELEGMLTCDFVRDEETGKISYENVTWVPLVNHNDGETAAVYALKDYTEDLAAAHRTFGELDDPIAWLREQTAEVVGSEFAIDDGAQKEASDEQDEKGKKKKKKK